jgi:DNA-binding phage protein
MAVSNETLELQQKGAGAGPLTARLILRDLVNATIDFEQLATLTAKPSKSLHRMLSPTGNPSMDNLAAIFRAVRESLQVNLQVHSVAA